MNPLLEQLGREPALAWKLVAGVLGVSPQSSEAQDASRKVRSSEVVSTLLENRDTRGRPYAKWSGSHWILSLLADLGCPAGDESLRPLMDETLDSYLSPHHERYIRVVDGLTRRCASQEGNAVWSALRLGLADERAAELAARLIRWQWPDGGWNCDKRPQACKSSFMETLIPLRALALFAQASGDAHARLAVERAAELFLKRRLFKRLRDGSVMDEHFTLLHYPPYWHYDILFGLKVMAEAGFINDPRCNEALDLLESKRLADGGFPAEASYSRSTQTGLSGYSPVRWGGISKKTMNPFVTVDALYVLRLAGRWNAPASPAKTEEN